MSIVFKKTKFIGNPKTCLALFSNGKKNSSEKINSLKSKPDMSEKEALLLFNQTELDQSHAVVIELGEKKIDLTTECMREIGGKFYKEFKKSKATVVALFMNDFKLYSKDAASLVKGFVEGAMLAHYSMQEGKSKPKKQEKMMFEIYSSDSEAKSLKSLLNESEKMVAAVHFARTLGNLPGNMMTPTILSKKAQSTKTPGMKITVWDKARIKKEGMGCLLGVASGSDEPPKFIIMEYKNSKAKSKQPTILVGKGLTFDAGGISLKPSAKMDEMRYDMCGGAAVIGALKLISEMKLPVHVIGLVPSTENLLGGSACKPGDILKAKNGKTVEVLNTDAEGRLILADALSYASTLKPKQVLNTATLTGAMVVALGSSHTGFFTRNDDLSDKINNAASLSGENLWRMPLTDDHSKDMKGKYADLSNLSASRGAGSATAAAFLENFCDKDIPFAHLDIAGTAWNAGSRKSYHGSDGATGVLVRTFYEFVKKFA